MVVFSGCFGPPRRASNSKAAKARLAREQARAAHHARQARLRAAHAQFVAHLEARFDAGSYAPALCDMVDMGLPRRVADAITAFCVDAQIQEAHWDDMARFVVWLALGAFGMQWDRDVFVAWSATPVAARELLDAAWEAR